MKIGVGLPFQTPTGSWPRIRELAMRAEAGPFSSFGVLDRIAYNNHESLTLLAGVAAVTERLRLVTAILIGPLRNPGLLAKQAATVDAISKGRLTLGIAVGSREDDYTSAGASFHDRGKRFDAQLAHMRRIWAGEKVDGATYAVGPEPVQQGGPELLIGGSSPRAIARIGRYADGYVMGGRATDREWAKGVFAQVEESWRAAGRQGRPRVVASLPFALGPGAEEAVDGAIAHYYGGRSPSSGRAGRANLSTPEDIRAAIALHEELGTDEFIFRPVALDSEQLDRLADVIS